MSYSSIITNFKACMTDIGDALRAVLGTSKTYKLTEVADAIRTGCQVYYLGQGTSFNVSSVPGYKNLTANNFIVCTGGISSIKVSSWGSHDSTNEDKYLYPTWNKSYTPSSGIFKITPPSTTYAQVTSNSGVSGSAFYHYAGGTLTLQNPAVYLVVGSIKSI